MRLFLFLSIVGSLCVGCGIDVVQDEPCAEDENRGFGPPRSTGTLRVRNTSDHAQLISVSCGFACFGDTVEVPANGSTQQRLAAGQWNVFWYRAEPSANGSGPGRFIVRQDGRHDLECEGTVEVRACRTVAYSCP